MTLTLSQCFCFFCRTSLGTRGAGAVEVSLLGLMTKAAFDREMGCHLFLQMLPVEHAGVLLLFINPYDE